MKAPIILLPVVVLLFSFAAIAQHEKPANEDGLYLGLSFGTWFPDNANRIFGSPLIVGPVFFEKTRKHTLGFSMDLIGLPQHTTKRPFNISVHDSVLSRDEISGGHIMIDYSREVAVTGRFIFEAVASAGWGQICYYNPYEEDNVSNASLLFSPGLGVRYLVCPGGFWQLKVQLLCGL